MPIDCPVSGCGRSYLSAAPLGSHLAQASDGAHRKYYDNLYCTLNFDISAAPTAPTASAETRIAFETHVAYRVHENNVDEDDDDVDNDGGGEPELLDTAELQVDRKIVVESVQEEEEEEEELDAVAEAMGDLLRKFELTSEEELAEHLPVPDFGEPEEQTAGETPELLHRRLLDPPDAQVIDWHPTGGQVEYMDRTALDRWMKLTGNQPDGTYKPFRSQIDWQITHWAVKEKISQGSLDRLLSIPQVSLLLLSPVPYLLKLPLRSKNVLECLLRIVAKCSLLSTKSQNVLDLGSPSVFLSKIAPANFSSFDIVTP